MLVCDGEFGVWGLGDGDVPDLLGGDEAEGEDEGGEEGKQEIESHCDRSRVASVVHCLIIVLPEVWICESRVGDA